MKKNFIDIVVIILCILPLLYFFNRGFSFSDEGYILSAGRRIFEGEIPYRDFDFIYTPFSAYITAFSFFLFGQKIISGRIIALFASIFTIFLLIVTGKKISKSRFAYIIPVVVYSAWTPIHINFPWPVVLALPLGILSVLFLFKGFSEEKFRYFFLSGVFAAFVFFCKQTFGVAIFLAYFVALFIASDLRSLKRVATFFLGVFVAGTVFFVFFYITGSLRPFIEQTVLKAFFMTVVEKKLISFLPVDRSLYSMAKFLFYSSGGIAGILALKLGIKKKSVLIIAFSIFSVFFYTIGLLPEVDYVHMAGVMGIIGVPFLILFEVFRKSFISVIILTVIVAYTAIGFYSAYYKGYMRWSPPVAESTHFVGGNLGIWVHENSARNISEILQYNKILRKDSYIFVHPYMPTLYILISQKNATRFLLTKSDFIKEKKDILLRELKKHKPVRIFAQFSLDPKNPVNDFIKKHYIKEKKIGDISVYAPRE